MTERPGEPPVGEGRLVREALIATLRARAPDGMTWIEKVVLAIIEKGAGGDLAAVKEIFDRVEGRPGQAAAEPEAPRKLVFGWRNEGFP
jgi:hypothetical protein